MNVDGDVYGDGSRMKKIERPDIDRPSGKVYSARSFSNDDRLFRRSRALHRTVLPRSTKQTAIGVLAELIQNFRHMLVLGGIA